jgi:hypothetical protein
MVLRKTRAICEIIGVSFLGLLLLAGIAAWRLAEGPVKLDFLSSHIEEAVNGIGGTFKIKVGGTHLAWAGWKRTLDIRVKDVRAVGEDSRVIARVPEMSVTFSLRALARGIVAPTSFDIIAPRIGLIRNSTGELALMVEEQGTVDAGLFTGLIGALGAKNDPARPISYLRRLSILNARLSVDDRLTGIKWEAPEIDLILLREQGEIRATMFGAIDVKGTPVRLDANAAWKPGENTIDLSVGLEPVRVDRLAALSPAFEVASAIKLPVSGRASILLGVDGTVHDGSFEFHGEAGRIVAPALWKDGLPVSDVKIAGRFNSDPGMIEFERFSVDIGGPKVEIKATVLRLGESLSINGDVKLDRVALDRLPRYWPKGTALKARRWVLGRMSQGLVEDAATTVSFLVPDIAKPELVLELLSGRMRMRDATIDYLPGLPKIEKLVATAVFRQDRFIANVSKAEVAGLMIENGTVRLTGLDADNETATIETSIDGTLSNSLALIDHDPLRFARSFGIDPRKVAGQTKTRLKLRMPIREELLTSQIDIDATSRITGADLPSFAFGQSVEAGNFELKVDKKRLQLEGTARVAGFPAKLKWLERFDPRARIVRQYEANAIVDVAALKRFGLATLSPYVQGALALDIAYLKPPKGVAEMVVKAGLKQSSLYLPGFDWRKPSGEDGLAWLSLVVPPVGPVTVKDFDLRTRKLRARGGVSFTAKGELRRLDLRRFEFGRTKMGATVVIDDNGVYDISVKGDVLDATPFVEKVNGDSETTTLPPLRLKGNLGRVWFDPEIPVDRVRAKLIHDGIGWVEADLTGTLGKDRTVALKMSAVGNRRDVKFTSDNAGAALRALDLIDTIRGGKLVLSGTQQKSGDKAPWAGVLKISDFTMVRAPVLARVLTLASLTGITNVLSGKGIGFTSLDVPFTYRDGLATIKKARFVGSELGLTADGIVNTRKKNLGLNGMIIPAYTINSALGNIPIVGKLFSGSKGGGIFAATYKISGSIAKPNVSVNPLAALAPGILRDILGIFGPIKPGEMPGSRAPKPGDAIVETP